MPSREERNGDYAGPVRGGELVPPPGGSQRIFLPQYSCEKGVASGLRGLTLPYVPACRLVSAAVERHSQTITSIGIASKEGARYVSVR